MHQVRKRIFVCTVDLRCSLIWLAFISWSFRRYMMVFPFLHALDRAWETDRKHHFKAMHKTAQVRSMMAAIATITRPRISQASPISNLATFLIFLCRCHDVRFLRSCVPPVWLADPGEMASCGSTWREESLRSQVESCGCW